MQANNNENKDTDVASPVRAATLPSPAAGTTAALSSSPNTSKSRFAHTTGGAQDALGALPSGLGTKSMPGSRRTSAIPGGVAGEDSGSFGLDKLSLGDNKAEDATVSTRCALGNEHR